jgi:hypothetical protein
MTALVSQFDSRYDRIAPDTAHANAAAAGRKTAAHAGSKTALPQNRLQRLRACIRAAFLCKSVLCGHVMHGATLAGLHHPGTLLKIVFYTSNM